jgi:hypothetical protein
MGTTLHDEWKKKRTCLHARFSYLLWGPFEFNEFVVKGQFPGKHSSRFSYSAVGSQ